MQLSGQAQWYLRGSFPVYERKAVGERFSVEPKAMQELVDKGLAVRKEHPLLGWYWSLTAAGSLEKNFLEFPPVAR